MKITITNDADHRNKILAALEKRGGYCPCSIDQNDDTICMCKEFREQTTEGPCHCGLYIKYHDTL